MLGSDFMANQGPLGVRMGVGMVASGSEQVFSSSSNAKSSSATMVMLLHTLLCGAGLCRCCLEILVKEFGVYSGSCSVRICRCTVYGQPQTGHAGSM